MTVRLATLRRRDPHDREILRLAVPALGALAAEPLYVLVDTAIVGRLGTEPLAGLAVAGIVLTSAFAIFNFLAYTTTGAVARQVGAGDRRAAAEQGIDGTWLAAGLGVALTVLGLAVAPAVVSAMGASADVAPHALTYLRISLLGAPAMLVMLAGAGYLRGLQDTRTTLLVAVGSNVANLTVELVLVYGLDLGIAGSAWSTVIAQVGGAAVYLGVLGRTARAAGAATRPRAGGVRKAAVVGGQLVVRTAALLAALLTATAVASRIGDDAVAAHQIAFQVWILLAMSLDALAIAGQAMVGRLLGAGDPAEARAAARRMVELGLALGVTLGAGLALARPWLAPLFTEDPDVRHLALEVLWVVAALQPLNAVVFVLDGVLIGAGDARYLAGAMVAAGIGVFVPLAVGVLELGGGLMALWAALCLLMVARLAGNAWRFAGGRWLVTGALAPGT
ncbi:MAG: MATE family efflux transporter [Acidimicrobiia bacterium]|nr:MATE family efflux transporter [Acidimicrobiia bacterium]